MHDPDVQVFRINYPWWTNPRKDWRYHKSIVEFWHGEPAGRDSGTVCKGMKGTNLSWHNVKWAIRHHRHITIIFPSYRRIKRWMFDKCAGCGFKFQWKQPRFSMNWDGHETFHESCSNVIRLNHLISDLDSYILRTADSTVKWRVEYRMKLKNEQK